ncbi:MAG: RNA polymerase sigma factor [Phycisphaerae bacterium]
MELAIPANKEHPREGSNQTGTAPDEAVARDLIIPFDPSGKVQPTVNDTERPTTADRSHLKQAFRSAADALYRFILVRVGHHTAVADDLLQQTCCVAAGHQRVPAQPADCEAWLFGIARNLVREHWRKSQNAPQPLPDHDELAARLEEAPLPEELLQNDETRQTLLTAITELSVEDQHLIFACYFMERPQSEVAEELHTTRKSIESKLYRARLQLRERLKANESLSPATQVTPDNATKGR